MKATVRQVASSAGAVVNRADYDSFGRVQDSVESIEQPYAFTGREFDDESGLYYYRARYYDPQTGRSLSEDPIGFSAGDSNLYRYVFNNPANLADPSGNSVLIQDAFTHCFSTTAGLATGGFFGAVFGTIIGALNAVLSTGETADSGQILSAAAAAGTAAAATEAASGAVGCRRGPGKGGSSGSKDKPPIPVTLACHHLLPQAAAFGGLFANLNIHQYVILIPEPFHRRIHSRIGQGSGGAWNNAWRQFERNNPGASNKQIRNHMKQLRRQFNLPKGPVISFELCKTMRGPMKRGSGAGRLP